VFEGDISYRKLHIEDGAQFEGQCDLVDSLNTKNVNA
jgi:cytoskeletal protein CcmA (bactofilin family)